ncbi:MULTISPECIES: lytic murein transglycosylase [Pseudoalteromonas]|uniref:Membrane-bound lytic murein transglycosylase B n=1 Tax=Pseudoalteromonas carrageenovora IAM 12662 TaxID=1314868 RepID=A0A2K4XFP5_PSEVC|nr:lytic murein transglycosylase [Pseudoalteromonas carrageenovora]MBE0384766.1 membrane-bound lytic murein transglycosylase B [Pseudoalteromonas carrageenovora IAM 12662]MCQ8890293.1 lytic murein transglycosylase [Pseudoalteromonas carrageenovora]MDO6463622.1 lytic murein transglycosylase [Pseudoalteromonas carrageenovora]MDO6635015.1 lytic murein transglycosylase [Pseudoalteromonas carrageenovora]MDO6647669.1 lytic murein transglycosylase [Pseudoalteromonas carrageenovora]
MIKKLTVLLCGVCLSGSVMAKTQAEFQTYLANLKHEAIAKGYDSKLIDDAFATATYKEKVVSADKNQPEVKETLETYLPKRVPQWKIDRARKLYAENKDVLEQVAKEFGVQARFIVALWGLESNFGAIQGGHNVISSLVTLAFDGRREALYKRQLWAALDILKSGHITLDKFKGSWAGAMGQTQFMPTSFNAYAVDYNNDGRKDIWTTKEDAFASIANYLKQEGWNDSLTWGRQVQLPENFDSKYVLVRGTKTRKQWLEYWNDSERSLADWQALGVRKADGSDLPNVDVRAALVMPDDINGRMYLAYDNYKVFMHWNRSYYFATSVGYLSDRIGYPKI